MPMINVNIQMKNGETINKAVNVEEQDIITCPKCNGRVLQDGKKVYRVSRLLLGSPEDLMVQTIVPYCVKCGAEIPTTPPTPAQKQNRTRIVSVP